MDAPWSAQADAVTRLCQDRLPGLVGVYVHGSAALGGFGPGSDLDVLVVAEESGCDAHLGQALLAVPGRPLELSVVTPAAAARPAAPWPFVLHVAGPDRVITGLGAGDEDLIAHYAVVRQSGLRIAGPPPAEVVGAVAREVLLAYVGRELRWGLAQADERYAVLNACRAVAYVRDGVLLSKLAGADWWADREKPGEVVRRARAAQLAGTDLGPTDAAAWAFVTAAIAEVDSALG